MARIHGFKVENKYSLPVLKGLMVRIHGFKVKLKYLIPVIKWLMAGILGFKVEIKYLLPVLKGLMVRIHGFIRFLSLIHYCSQRPKLPDNFGEISEPKACLGKYLRE